MLNIQRASTTREDQDHDDQEHIRDIHALTPPHPPSAPANPPRRREAWETNLSSTLSIASEGGTSSNENFTTMSREFNALVIAGSSMDNNNNNNNENENDSTVPTNVIYNNLSRIGEEAEVLEETNPLAIVPDNNPLPLPRGVSNIGTGSNLLSSSTNNHGEVSVQRVKKEEVETKISAWQTAKIAKINNRFKREDAIINGWESAEVQKATSWMKKVERKLEEKRARALEKMQNEVARARRKAEEKRASAEAKRGTKVARVLEVANLMKAVGRPPAKRSFF